MKTTSPSSPTVHATDAPHDSVAPTLTFLRNTARTPESESRQINISMRAEVGDQSQVIQGWFDRDEVQAALEASDAPSIQADDLDLAA